VGGLNPKEKKLLRGEPKKVNGNFGENPANQTSGIFDRKITQLEPAETHPPKRGQELKSRKMSRNRGALVTDLRRGKRVETPRGFNHGALASEIERQVGKILMATDRRGGSS